MRLRRETDRLKKDILALSAVVEDAVQKAIVAAENRDPIMAKGVIQGDDEIDAMEVDLEEECLKILALHQPVAMDLRFIIAVLKINNDLERIGDLAANIAQRVISLSEYQDITIPSAITQMMEKVLPMLHKSLDALVNTDRDMATEVLTLDDEVDRIHRSAYLAIQRRIEEDPSHLSVLIQWLSVSRYLERIADQATNIAEDVIYMLEGEIVRHQGEDAGK
jgi:phosphate transport system protein